MHDKVFFPSIFIAHEPQTPWAHELLNVSDGSISFLILNKMLLTWAGSVCEVWDGGWKILEKIIKIGPRASKFGFDRIMLDGFDPRITIMMSMCLDF